MNPLDKRPPSLLDRLEPLSPDSILDIVKKINLHRAPDVVFTEQESCARKLQYAMVMTAGCICAVVAVPLLLVGYFIKKVASYAS